MPWDEGLTGAAREFAASDAACPANPPDSTQPYIWAREKGQVFDVHGSASEMPNRAGSSRGTRICTIASAVR